MVRVNLVINVLMGRVRAPARLRIYVSEWQKVHSYPMYRRTWYLLWPSLPQYGSSVSLIKKTEKYPYTIRITSKEAIDVFRQRAFFVIPPSHIKKFIRDINMIFAIRDSKRPIVTMIGNGFIIVSLRLNTKLLAWNKDPSLIPFVKEESDLQNPNQDFWMLFPSHHSRTLQPECTTSLK